MKEILEIEETNLLANMGKADGQLAIKMCLIRSKHAEKFKQQTTIQIRSDFLEG